MDKPFARLTAWSLMAGSVVGTIGYLAAFLANGNGLDRFAGSSWIALYTVAMFGDVLVILGLPAIVHAQRGRFPRLTLIGYVGVLVPMIVLNVGEGAIEGFAKPYFAHHGGVLAADLPGLAGWEIPALLTMLVGMICLGIAVIRGRVMPIWVGVVFLIVPFLGLAGLPGILGLLADFSLFVGLFAVGLCALGVDAPVTRGTQAAAEGVAA
ncbi:MAG: hypothetical protein J2P22_01495 [Nocardioides sp.]|nr:hypothetical protein [Nocardioides sp.]